MENFKQKATHNTPKIEGSVEEGMLSITGVCRPENSVDFFRPLINWVNYFKLNAPNSIKVVVDLEYLNTSSGMILFRILSTLKSGSNGTDSLGVVWKYNKNDDDMKQVGEDFYYMLGEQTNFQIIDAI
jgi:hypothetical protein